MSNILIQNRGELPIWGMRLLGLSNKTSDQIGQFGTGLKESIALLARMDLYMVIYSGTCRIDFSTQSFDDQDELCFQLSEPRGRFAADEWHGLGIHPNFGKADWCDPWMMFREILCNALDESGVDSLHHDIVSTEPSGVVGATRVYVPVTPEILAAYATIHEKLLQLGDYEIEQVRTGSGRAIKKRNKKGVQIYYRDVWVMENEDHESLFDYDLDDLKLNESRSADWYDVNNKVAQLVAGYTVEQVVVLLDKLVVAKDETCYEQVVLATASMYANVEDSSNWVAAFAQVFGQDAVVTDNSKHFYERLDQTGHKPIIIEDDSLRKLLKKAGVPHAAVVLSHEQYDYKSVGQPDERLQSLFDDTWALFVRNDLIEGKTKPGLMTFLPRSGDSTVVFGQYKDGVCYINEEHAESLWERLACVEEIAHHVSGAHDHTSAFQIFLLKCAVAFAGLTV